jgi:hypothetical protein
MNALVWNAKTGNNNLKPSIETIWLLFKARGLPIHKEVHTIATKGINCRALLTKVLA